MSALINLYEFARSGQRAEGELELIRMLRLESPKREGVLRWQAVGFVSRQKKPQLDLEIAGIVDLVCQRCLEPVKLKLALQRRFLVARSEQEADEVPMDDDHIEVVVGSESFDIEALVEDEVLLSLPLVPMHQDCHHPELRLDENKALSESIEGKAAESKPSPFAVLEKLKSK